jgi:hypothetical protein
MVDTTTMSCHTLIMNESELPTSHAATFGRIKEIRARAIEHTIQARRLSAERRDLMEGLIREAIQKMLAC